MKHCVSKNIFVRVSTENEVRRYLKAGAQKASFFRPRRTHEVSEMYSSQPNCSNPCCSLTKQALHPVIVTLTGIKQSDVESAPDIVEAYLQLAIWMAPYESQRSLNALTWGGGDSEDLRAAVGLALENKASGYACAQPFDCVTLGQCRSRNKGPIR